MMAILAGTIFGLAIIGTPIFAVMGLAALGAFHITGVPVSAVPAEMFRLVSSPTLVSIPLFTFAGHVLARSDSPKRMLRLAQNLVGWLPGGIAIMGLAACAFFTAFTGASGVTIIALGTLLYPMLVNEGYSEKFSLGLITTSGSLGLLFPPSLPLILYGIVAKADIDKLFLAGIIPGVLIISILSGWAAWNAPEKKIKPISSWADMWPSIKDALWEIILPVGVLVAIYGGFATVTETAALTCIYVLIVECFLRRELSLFNDIPRVMVESMAMVGAILLILCCALGVTNFLVDEEIPMKLMAFMQTWITSKLAFLLVLNIFLLVVGCLMDIFSAIIIVVPLIIPVAHEFGVNPFHLGIIFLTNLEIGYITPPVGINLFIAGLEFKKSITSLYRVSLPFFLLLLIALALITYVPFISMWWN